MKIKKSREKQSIHKLTDDQTHIPSRFETAVCLLFFFASMQKWKTSAFEIHNLFLVIYYIILNNRSAHTTETDEWNCDVCVCVCTVRTFFRQFSSFCLNMLFILFYFMFEFKSNFIFFKIK